MEGVEGRKQEGWSRRSTLAQCLKEGNRFEQICEDYGLPRGDMQTDAMILLKIKVSM